MEITAEMVKNLRQQSGAGIMECKNALKETSGDVEEAVIFLRKKGLAKADKKADRLTSEGTIGTYIHPGNKIGVMVEVLCETDFVANTPDFQQLSKDICMHIAASKPRFVSREEVTVDVLEREKEIYAAQARDSGKPEKIIDKIVLDLTRISPSWSIASTGILCFIPISKSFPINVSLFSFTFRKTYSNTLTDDLVDIALSTIDNAF